MSPLELLSTLSSLWFVFDGEDENKKPIVTRRNVLPFAIKYFKDGNTSITEFWDQVCDTALQFPVNMTICGDILDGYSNMDKKSIGKNELLVSTFVHAYSSDTAEDPDFYYSIAEQIACSMNISVDENDVNDSFWEKSIDDGLTPIQAINSLRNISSIDAIDEILEYLCETSPEITHRYLSRILGKDVDTDSEPTPEARKRLLEMDKDVLEKLYNELLNQNAIIVM
jgi:hypothetical protein